MEVKQTAGVEQIIEKYEQEGYRGPLIQVLLEVQKEHNWLPKEELEKISEKMKVPLTEVYRVASFYKALSLTRKGQHLVSVCLGTACHVRGGQKIADKVSEVLDIKAGETTGDGKFSFSTVNCLGCCALHFLPLSIFEVSFEVAPDRVIR